MKICFILEHFYPHIGGVETVFFEYAKRLTEKGNEIRVITSNSGGITGISEVNNFKINYLKCKSFFGHPLLPTSKIESYAKWADIIHTTTYTAAISAIKIAKKLKKPCLITVHEALGLKWFKVEKNPIKAFGFLAFEYYTIKKNFDCWHVISNATKNDIMKYRIPKDKIKLIYHGIDNEIWNPLVKRGNLNEYLGFDKNKKILLYSGRPGKTKGIFILLKAIKTIKNKINSNFRFGFILSNDPLCEKERIKKNIKKNNLEKLVKVADAVNIKDLPTLKKSAYAIIIPSITEGFGFSAVEASLLDVPIISSDAGSLPEVVFGKVLFFKNGNHKELSTKINLATENKFNEISTKKFNWNDSIEKLSNIYKKIINLKSNGK